MDSRSSCDFCKTSCNSLDLSDAVSCARKGDNAAWDAIYTATRAKLVGHLYVRCHDSMLAEDVAQEAFLRAFVKLAQLEDDDDFIPWLFTIADHRLSDVIRHSASQGLLVELEHIDSSRFAQQDCSCPGSNIHIDIVFLDDVLASLPPLSRQALLLTCHGYTAAQVAAVLELTVTGCEKRISRGRETLRGIRGEER